MDKILIKNDEDRNNFIQQQNTPIHRFGSWGRKHLEDISYPYIIVYKEVDGFNGSYLHWETVELKDFNYT